MITNVFARCFQKLLFFASSFLNWHEPTLHHGEGSLEKARDIIENSGMKKPLVVSGNIIRKTGLLLKLTAILDSSSIEYTVFTDVPSDPDIEDVELLKNAYISGSCDCIIALGGGSVLDCCKAAGARIGNPQKTVEKMRGLLKIRRRLPLLIAIPTTAGTGSEATIAAVVSNRKTTEKYAIMDPKLIPSHAILDPQLTISLPPATTAATGMDAFTHAVEAYIGRSNTKATKANALKAISLIDKSIVTAFEHGDNIKARSDMLDASYYAGLAFTRAYVGAVHAMAHTLGAHYHVSHGLAVAVILPHVLRYYGKTAEPPLSEIAAHLKIGSGKSEAEDALNFIKYIGNLNKKLNIPENFAHVIKDEDIPEMSDTAFKEAVPLYPTPKILTREDYRILFKTLQNNRPAEEKND